MYLNEDNIKPNERRNNMERRVYFIVSAIIQIAISIYIIFTAGALVQNEVVALKAVYEAMPNEVIGGVIKNFESNGVNSIRVCSGISILVNIGIMVTAIKNTILRNKGLLITGSIVCLLFSGSEITELIAIVNIIVLLCSKRKNPEDFPVKKELPKLEAISITKKEIFIGIALALIYFSQFIWGNYLIESNMLRWTIIIVFYLSVLLLSIAFWNKSIKRDLKTFKENFITYIKFILHRFGLMYIIYFIVTIITIIITKEIGSVNQQNLESLPSWYVIPLAVIYAPIVEETIFRGLIHKIIKNRKIFVIVSAICFGLLHTISVEVTLMNVIVKALPYSVLGGFLAYIYTKTENISTNMFCHFAINAIASLLTLV